MTTNQKVGGSNPSGRAKQKRHHFCGVSFALCGRRVSRTPCKFSTAQACKRSRGERRKLVRLQSICFECRESLRARPHLFLLKTDKKRKLAQKSVYVPVKMPVKLFEKTTAGAATAILSPAALPDIPLVVDRTAAYRRMIFKRVVSFLLHFRFFVVKYDL